MLSWWIVGALAAPPDAGAWEATLEEVAPAVVSIEVTATRDFDTEDASSTVGTGFVVDAERGILLTNRHMVHAGPVNARAVFLDNEEAALVPLYRDPVHDFGFYRFDPADLRFMEVTELTLAPTAAKVGLDIRVIGNDAGEKLSILDGTLARLDRNAPRYGGNTYNDFNTFYYQAASNTSGGSSGSPVVDVKGRVVALNAGGRTEAAQSFYLPLHRVVRALDFVRRGEVVPRGTVTTTLRHEAWQDLVRLGLRPDTEARVRAAHPDISGMLVVADTLPQGPGDGKVQPGDIVVELDGELVVDFVQVEEVIDARVGSEVALTVERLGQRVEVTLPVLDLHALTPARFLEVSRGILHDLSYQQARNHDQPLGGVYVASAGYMLGIAGIGSGALLLQIDGEPLATLDDAVRILSTKADGQRLRLRHAPVSDPRRARESLATMDRTWFSMRSCARDDVTGTWPCTEAAAPPSAAPPPEPATPLPHTASRRDRRFADALVLVGFDVPYSTAGVSGQSFLGTGVVVDATRGLVLVDRDTVPVALGDLVLTFAGAVRVPGEVVYLHPEHNVAVVQYDPVRLGELEVGEVAFDPAWRLERGQELRVVGLDRSGSVVVDEAEVEDVDTLYVGPSGTPRFREQNVEVARLARVERSVGGVAVDRRGRVLGLWASYFFPKGKDRYFYVLPSPYLAPTIDALREGRDPGLRDAGVELGTRSLADARELGLSDARIREAVRHDPDELQVLQVIRVSGGAPAQEVLREADLIVTVDGAPVSRLREVRDWSRREEIPLVVLRNGEEVDVSLRTQPADGRGVRQVLSWAGMLLHDPHPEVAADTGVVPEGAYVAWYWYGSPAARDGMRPTRRIVAVDGIATPDLARLQEVVLTLDPARPVVLTLEDVDEVRSVRTLELDPESWPTELISWRDGAWVRERLDPYRDDAAPVRP